MSVQVFKPQGALETALAAVFRLTLKTLLKPALSPRWSIARSAVGCWACVA